MDISIFDVTGPVMIGPSSSHTAGAARLARVARTIAAGPFSHVSFGLHGSFAKTYKGHGTDKALVAGALGLWEDDEKLCDAFDLAADHGLTYDFHQVELEGVHENAVELRFFQGEEIICTVVGSSIGGAQIVIHRINGFDTEFSAISPTLIIRQHDRKGVVNAVTQVLAENDINIGVMRLSRNAKGATACCIIEADTPIPPQVAEQIRTLPHIISAQAINTRAKED